LFLRPKKEYKGIIRRFIVRGTYKGEATNPRVGAKRYYGK
jgi:hypothetical protein